MIFDLDYFDVGFEFSTCIFDELLETLKGPANKESLEHDINKHIYWDLSSKIIILKMPLCL